MNSTTLFAGRTCSGRLWTDHPATPKQAQLAFKSSRKRARPTQADLIVELLREARANGSTVQLPQILGLGVAQHFVVRNEMERSSDGCVLSRYWLEHDPERDGQR